MCVAIKIVGFCYGCKNIYLVCLIAAAVTIKDYDSESDRWSS